MFYLLLLLSLGIENIVLGGIKDKMGKVYGIQGDVEPKCTFVSYQLVNFLFGPITVSIALPFLRPFPTSFSETYILLHISPLVLE